MFLWTALIVGIVGSLHCIGMCGPLAAALPYSGTTRWSTTMNMLQYHMGRIFTYAMLGGLIGLIGRGVFLAGWQRGFSIVAGIILLILAISSQRPERGIMRIPGLRSLFTVIKDAISALLRSTGRSSFVLIGMINGLLPCGLVYLAITGAMATGSIGKSMIYMAMFGLGTVPLMLLTALAGTIVGIQMRRSLQRIVPVFLVLFGMMLIFRGVNFNIPAGFSFWEALVNQPMCH